VSECDREASIKRRPWLERGCCSMEIEIVGYIDANGIKIYEAYVAEVQNI
jgi:hypothetical protein